MRFFSVCAALLLSNCLLALGATNGLLSLSHYDEIAPDYVRLRSQGIEGIIHEASYPPSVRDAKYIPRQSSAQKAGLLWGAYHFGNATNGVKQADHFLSVVRAGMAASPSDSGVLLILDAEKNGHYPGGTMQAKQAIDFIRRVHERTGIYPGVYSNERWLEILFHDRNLDAEARATLGKCWLWIANYTYRPVKTKPWNHWMLWQYTGDGKCLVGPRSSYPVSCGNMRNIERTIFNGDRGALRGFWANHAWRP